MPLMLCRGIRCLKLWQWAHTLASERHSSKPESFRCISKFCRINLGHVWWRFAKHVASAADSTVRAFVTATAGEPQIHRVMFSMLWQLSVRTSLLARQPLWRLGCLDSYLCNNACMAPSVLDHPEC